MFYYCVLSSPESFSLLVDRDFCRRVTVLENHTGQSELYICYGKSIQDKNMKLHFKETKVKHLIL